MGLQVAGLTRFPAQTIQAWPIRNSAPKGEGGFSEQKIRDSTAINPLRYMNGKKATGNIKFGGAYGS